MADCSWEMEEARWQTAREYARPTNLATASAGVRYVTLRSDRTGVFYFGGRRPPLQQCAGALVCNSRQAFNSLKYEEQTENKPPQAGKSGTGENVEAQPRRYIGSTESRHVERGKPHPSSYGQFTRCFQFALIREIRIKNLRG